MIMHGRCGVEKEKDLKQEQYSIKGVLDLVEKIWTFVPGE